MNIPEILTKDDKVDLIEKMNRDKIDLTEIMNKNKIELIKWMFVFWITIMLILIINLFR